MLRRLTALVLVAVAGLVGCSERPGSRARAPQPLVVPDDLCLLAGPVIADRTRWELKAVEHATEGGDQPRATCRLEGGPDAQHTVVELEWVPSRTVEEARAELAADCQLTVSAPVASASATQCERIARNDKGLATGEVARADLAADLPGVLVASVVTESKRFAPTAPGELRDVASALLELPELAG